VILFSILISRAFKARGALVCAVHRRCPQLCRLFTFRVWQVGLIAWFRWLLSDGQVVFEAYGVDEAADGVVREVTESRGDAT